MWIEPSLDFSRIVESSTDPHRNQSLSEHHNYGNRGVTYTSLLCVCVHVRARVLTCMCTPLQLIGEITPLHLYDEQQLFPFQVINDCCPYFRQVALHHQNEQGGTQEILPKTNQQYLMVTLRAYMSRLHISNDPLFLWTKLLSTIWWQKCIVMQDCI